MGTVSFTPDPSEQMSADQAFSLGLDKGRLDGWCEAHEWLAKLAGEAFADEQDEQAKLLRDLARRALQRATGSE